MKVNLDKIVRRTDEIGWLVPFTSHRPGVIAF